MIRISFQHEIKATRKNGLKTAVWVGFGTAFAALFWSLLASATNVTPIELPRETPDCLFDNTSLLNTIESSTASDLHHLCEARERSFAPLSIKTERFNREDILDDYKGRISEEFQVPAELRKRVAFWFDVYTKYPSYVKILHHSRYPWIQYRQLDITGFLASPKAEWMNVQAAEKFVARERTQIVQQLLRLSRRKKFDNLNAQDRRLFDLLAEIPGPRRKVFQEAAHSVRIQTGQMDFYVEGLVRRSQYLDEIEQIFQNQNLPTELTLIPLVESSFNPFANSRVGAAGIWQFMVPTARHIMVVNDKIDERRSPIKSSVGAARYLKFNYRALFNSWPLAVMAYNHGPTALRKLALKRHMTRAEDLINKVSTRGFSFASKNYYPEFLAAVYAEKYQNEIFEHLRTLKRVNFDAVTLHQPLRLNKISRATGLSKNILLSYNLDLQSAAHHNFALPAGYVIHLPVGYAEAINALNVSSAHHKRVAKAGTKMTAALAE